MIFGNPADGSASQIITPTSGTVLPDGITHVLTFRLPAGLGPNRAVRVVTYPRSMIPAPGAIVGASSPVWDTIIDSGGLMSFSDTDVPPGAVDLVRGTGSFFSYAPPQITGVSVSLPFVAADQAVLAAHGVTCNSTGCGPYVKLSLSGVNFGPSGQVTGETRGVMKSFLWFVQCACTLH